LSEGESEQNPLGDLDRGSWCPIILGSPLVGGLGHVLF
jgi:hypothetical protein